MAWMTPRTGSNPLARATVDPGADSQMVTLSGYLSDLGYTESLRSQVSPRSHAAAVAVGQVFIQTQRQWNDVSFSVG